MAKKKNTKEVIEEEVVEEEMQEEEALRQRKLAGAKNLINGLQSIAELCKALQKLPKLKKN